MHALKTKQTQKKLHKRKQKTQNKTKQQHPKTPQNKTNNKPRTKVTPTDPEYSDERIPAMNISLLGVLQ